MKTTDPRDLTFEEIHDSLGETREAIWKWLRANGPATTSRIAEGSGIGLLTVRPRVSELAVLGFVECIGREHREGVYRSITYLAAQARHNASRAESQLQLKI